MTRKINLALQGGGAHGAFTWGVLDRLLEESDLEFASISGTSAGALNAAVLKAGLLTGGREGARENLDWLWQQMGAPAEDGPFAAFQALWPPASEVSRATEWSPAFFAADTLSRMGTPYVTEPILGHPLERILRRVKWNLVCAKEGPRLFISATNVRTGKIRVFEGTEIDERAILASACLPTLFRAVEIDDPRTGRREAYWDGGYAGNPALFPMFEMDLPDDIVIVNINPLNRDEIPMAPHDIQNRINEISFNSSLLRELRAIAFVKRLIKEGKVEKGAMKDVHVHMIADDALMNELSVATKMVPNPIVLADLKKAGRQTADTWLGQHGHKIDKTTSVDLIAMFS